MNTSRLTSIQRRHLMEQTIKSDVLRDWIEKLREAFDRTMFYKNFVEGLAVEGLEEYISQHPEDRERAEMLRDPIKMLVTQAQAVNKLLVDIDQRVGRPATEEQSAAETGSPTREVPEAAPEGEALPETPAEAPAGEEGAEAPEAGEAGEEEAETETGEEEEE